MEQHKSVLLTGRQFHFILDDSLAWRAENSSTGFRNELLLTREVTRKYYIFDYEENVFDDDYFQRQQKS